MAKAKATSSVIKLLDLVWGSTNSATEHSYERLNHAMRHTLELAIGAGFEFKEGDIQHIFNSYRSGYWLSESSEWIYTNAITVGNMSAIKSFEWAVSRHGFLADDVDIGVQRSSFVHLVGDRKRERLCVGASFAYRGLRLTVTSFSDDSSYVNACSYVPKDEYQKKIDKRFKITRDDIISERAERKERNKLLELLAAHARANRTEEEIRRELGAKTESDYARLPIEKIRKVAKKFTSESEAK